MKRAIVFGSGHVARPAIRTLLDTGHHVLVATDDPEAAREMLEGHEHSDVAEVDATERRAVRNIVARGDAVLSLLPAALHTRLAEACLAERRHFVSTSYVTEEMRFLDGIARRRGLLLLNETGADPGVDHMQASRAVKRIQKDGGRVVSLRSVCGGLPAPEFADNPFRYKLSWTPQGVVLAGGRSARYLENDELVHVRRFHIFDRPLVVRINGLGDFESLPNGDSLRYLDAYGLDEPQTLFRGTLRWPGWSETWSALCRLGFVDDTPDAGLSGSTYGIEMWHAAGGRGGESPRSAVARALALPPTHAVLDRLDWLGMFSDAPLPDPVWSRADLLVARMEAMMRYQEGEQDMVTLLHEIDYKDADDHPHSLRAYMTVLGEPGGDTGMARLVGLPAAFAIRRILDGTIQVTGVRIPVLPEIFGPILKDLADTGLRETEEHLTPS